MPSRRAWLLLLLAVVLRLLTQGWDSGLMTPHPDERQVAFVSQKVVRWLDDPGFYAYGSLHFRAVRAVTAVLGMERGYLGLLTGGRALSLLASVLAMLLGWWMASRAWGRRSGELFLLLMAFVPLDIQQSHFATVEAHHAFWVAATLAACFWLATRSGWLPALVAGAAAGASLAVKVASLPLLLPLGLALVMAARRQRGPGFLELAGVAAAGGLAAFWLGQPWAMADAMPPLIGLALAVAAVALARIARRRRGLGGVGLRAGAAGALAVLAVLVVVATQPLPAGSEGPGWAGVRCNPDYLRGVGEQVAMVAGQADLPYVRVYRDTLPFLYPARELARWGLGPLLFLAALGGTLCGGWWSLRRLGRWLGRVTSPGTVLMVLLLAWLVPMSLRLATLQVKYLRYFEPLVVSMVLVVAWWLLRLPSRWGRPAVMLTASCTVLWGLMYLWGFATPHPHRTAAEWLGQMVDSSQVVAFEHWDETVDLPGVTRIDLPSYDLPDDDDKVRRWTQVLERADWVVLTSNRVRRTVLVNRDRFPRTGRLYRLLLTGEAGFEPVARAERAPRLFGLTRPVQLSDESFLNYDFPRVVILRRVGPVDAERLTARSSRPLPYLEQLGPAALDDMAVAPLEELPWSPGKLHQAVQLTIWLVVFAGFGVAAWALLLPLVRSWPDAGLGLSLVAGWMVPAWVVWLGSELGVWSVGPASATMVFLAMTVAGGVAGWGRRRTIVRIWRARRSGILAVAVVTAAIGLLFLAVRASNPAIFWGEKPMDFSFLNAFLRADTWPPDEPWMAGMPLHYYYFGQVLSAVPILIAGCQAAVGYNLMSATIPALGAALLAALGLAFVRRGGRLAAASLLPVLVLLTGNLAWPTLLDLVRDGRWFDAWWATSRVIPGFAIDEYPLWTTLFADLHGHFIALPVMIATLLWGWLVVQLPARRWLGAAALCGVGAAVLAATNPWDVFVLTSALAVGTVMAAPRPLRGMLRLAVAGAASVLAGLPYIIELVVGIGAGAGGRGLFLTDADFAPAWAVVLHFGQFLIPLLALAGATLLAGRWWIVALPPAIVGVALGLAMSSTAAALGLAAGSIMVVAALRAPLRTGRLAWSLAALAMVAVAACERFTLIDRMNTIFKVYNGVWVLLAVALGGLLLVERGWRRGLLAAVWLPLQLVALVNLPLGIAQGFIQPRTSSPRPTLDGQAFLPTTDPQTWFLVQGLMGMAAPGEVVAEAADLAYSDFTRIAMHTGQPTVVGWPWHLQQRGQSRLEIDARYRDLSELYGSPNPLAQREVLDRYRVRWVVLADLERRTYGVAAGDPFATVPGVIRVADSGEAALYLVRPVEGLEAVSRVVADRELPAEVTPLASLPPVHAPPTRSLALDDGGASVVLPDGSVHDVDGMGRLLPSELPLECEAISVARRGSVVWAACTDGSVWRRDDRAWRGLGTLTGATQLTAGDHLWAWGSGGLWRRQGSRGWEPVVQGPVVAAAATGGTLAFSDGRSVWTLRNGDRRRVRDAPDGLRMMAWQGTSLWALADGGLYRSGGAVLPWRQSLAAVGGVSAMAGSGDRLWLVLADGMVVQHLRPRCGSPWQVSGTGSELDQPRGLALSREGWFAVADTGHDRVAWFTLGGTCLEAVGGEGSAPGEFVEPTGLALADDGSLAVTDTWNGRVQILRPNGVIQVVGENLYGPRGALWVADGSLLVADTGNRVLLRFRAPDWRAEKVFQFQGPVVGLAQVAGLVAAAVPAEGAVLLLDLAAGEEVRRLAVPGWAARQQQEGYLTVLASGELVASAPDTGELWRLDPDGAVAPFRIPVTLPGVTGLVALPDGDVLVSQTYEHHLVRVSMTD